MFLFGTSAAASAPNFLPDEDSRSAIADALQAVIAQLGPPAAAPRWLTDASAPRDLDGLFDFLCSVQAQVGQRDIEFTLLDMRPGEPVPQGFTPLGDPNGHLLRTYSRARELVLYVAPQVFKVPSLLLGHVARELGRLGLWQQPTTPAVAELDSEVAAELAGVALGMGTWVANGAYMFNNACCGGGCGIDLGSVRAALSMPEAVLRPRPRRPAQGPRPPPRRHALESTQAAALKASWDACAPHLPALPAATATATAALRA
jgi:hypothetical protein